jgi:ArsR family transcriptional regulator, virulence genes transcriptional regulator
MNISEMEASAAAASRLLKSLANQHRLLILCQLVEGEKSVGTLEERLHLRQPHLSQLLARLRRDGLVRTRRHSRTIFYDLDSDAAAAILDLLYEFFCAPGGADARNRRPKATAKKGDVRAPAALPIAHPR